MWAIQIIESIKATGSESDLLVRWTGDQARMINAEQELGRLRRPAGRAAAAPVEPDDDRGARAGGPPGDRSARLSIGALVAFQSLLAGFNQPFRDLARLGADVQELRADLDRIDDVRHHADRPGLRAAPAGTARIEADRRRAEAGARPG